MPRKRNTGRHALGVAAARKARRSEVGRAVEGVDERGALELFDFVVRVNVAASAQEQERLRAMKVAQQTKTGRANEK